MSHKEIFVETQFFKRVKRPAATQVPTLEQLNTAGQSPAPVAIAPEHLPAAAFHPSNTSIFTPSNVSTPRPPLLSILPTPSILAQ